jgi:excisionase family DNA binding protein
LTLPQVSELLQRSRRSLEEDIAAGKLRVVHLGRSTRVPRMYVEQYVYGDEGCDQGQ